MAAVENTIAVVVGRNMCTQMAFEDIRRHTIRPSTSLNVQSMTVQPLSADLIT